VSGSTPPPDEAARAAIERYGDLLARASATSLETDAELDRAARQQEFRDRSAVTNIIMLVFAGALVLALVTFVIAGLFSGRWDVLAPQIVDVLKSVVLPVVTLVLGYYFGRGGR